jgi:hypothetical protein
LREVDRHLIEHVIHELRHWADAYPETIFKPARQEEVAMANRAFPGLLDTTSAAMGRHLGVKLGELADELERALGRENDDAAEEG